MTKCRSIFLLGILAAALPVAKLSAQTTTVEGTVRDSAGAVIANASVTIKAGSYQATITTDADGHFKFPAVSERSGSLEAQGPGFAPARQSWNAESTGRAVLDIVLEPALASEQITVSATRTEVRLSETPGSTVLLSQEDVTATPALRVDDVLRQVPGFSLFRQSGSRTGL